LEPASHFVVTRKQAEISFEPERVEHVGDGTDGHAGVAPLDRSQRRARHSSALGNELSGQPAPPSGQSNVLTDLGE